MVLLLERLKQKTSLVGLKINIAKKRHAGTLNILHKLKIQNQEIEQVILFNYLRSIKTPNVVADPDTDVKLANAFGILNKI